MKQILFEKEQTGINMSFILYIPKNINDDSTLILNGITPGTGTKKQQDKDEKDGTNIYGTYLDSYKEALQNANNGWYAPEYKKLAINYNNPMLIPIIPRCNELYTGFLGYDLYHLNSILDSKEFKYDKSKFTKQDFEKFRNLDEQIANMIYYSVDYINENYNLNLDYKVIATGYSASAKMVNFFAALHPELVKMIIAGATGGLCILPNKEYDYPLGFKDLPDENLELFKQIPQFYYIGDKDQTDPSRPEFIIKKDKDGNVVRDERGNTVPERENGEIKFIKDKDNNYILNKGGFYSLNQTNIIHPKYSDVQVRFDYNQNMYKDVNATFKKYKGNHDIEEEDKLEKDILAFYESNIKEKGLTI